ncbi:hypothetical protein [Mucilaginibacter sp. PAMB04168]|uniref:hypothetical protein n=1 Tax=Mucilaginibacter sp. PAMB04168 TaxID=3138567 RepID=UPI0031F6A6B0
MRFLYVSGLKLLLIAALICYYMQTNAQSGLQTGVGFPAEIENPEITGIGKEPHHATLMPYANLQEALRAKRHASSFSRSLNGLWKFNWVPTPQLRPINFYNPEFDVSS